MADAYDESGKTDYITDTLTDARDPAEAQQENAEPQPVFKVLGESKIPVSKHRGPLWKSRRDQVKRIMEDNSMYDAWDEAIRYYNNDHTRNLGDGMSPRNQAENARPGRRFSETENIVFANVSALVPMLYAKNPDMEVTAGPIELEKAVKVMEKLVSVLMWRKTAPGLNLKNKVKRGVVQTVLTNIAWFEVGYTFKQDSSELALENLQTLSDKLQKAKSQREIKELEGQLIALEETIDMLSPSGPWVKLRNGKDVLVDPAATDLDLSDAQWVMIGDWLPTEYLRARYSQKNEKGEYESIFAPTHVLKANGGNNAHEDEINSFSLFAHQSDDYKDYGYEDERSYRAGCMTRVQWVWDRATRRVELYNDKNWCYPLWVWDDPYQLDRFFPLQPMTFHTNPLQLYAKGEVTYYLDQQDGINQINSEISRIRFNAQRIGYNKNIIKDQETVENFVNGETQMTQGFDIPEGMKTSDCFFPVITPSAELIKFFDKKPLLEAIDRVSGVASVQRGVEYKTNTTNRAIESYESQMQTRADEKMDAIEEAIGGIGWLVLQLCLQFMDQETVAKLIGAKEAEGWENIEDPEEIHGRLVVQCVGGSTLKPTSRAKKEQALQLAQVIGQFSKATPVAIVVALTMLQRAFDELVITDQDWEMIKGSIIQQLQGGGPSGHDPEGDDAPDAGNRPQPSAQQQQGGGESESEVPEGLAQIMEEVSKFFDQLPEEVRKQLGILIARGLPIREAAARVISAVQQRTNQ